MPPYTKTQSSTLSRGDSPVGLTREQSPAEAEVSRLGMECETLFNMVVGLRDRLSPVLFESSNKVGGTDVAPENPLSPVFNAVRNHRYRIEDSQRVIASILNDLSI